jgi:Cys-rich protein (TIGR01571 family)
LCRHYPLGLVTVPVDDFSHTPTSQLNSKIYFPKSPSRCLSVGFGLGEEEESLEKLLQQVREMAAPGPARDWEYGLCGCCEANAGFWCTAVCCPCCAYCYNVQIWAKIRNKPDYACLDTMCCMLLTAMGGIGLCCSASHRTKIRESQNIPGSFSDDLVKHCCCFACAMTQEYEHGRSIVRAQKGQEYYAKQAAAAQANKPPEYVEQPPGYADYLQQNYGIGSTGNSSS